ncbi:DUF2793 domain-containing protein [Rhodopseudomonas sp. BAL398]|uniref:DUF2793 domain-containing protein n=1 Tax=Rhodopseudomonas TaxID=1073 RepID=UPI0009BC6BF7|nr:DUF2793 domain-containing protein [Rhodopseudomonas sp. BAL398]WOK19958.1 DUF2793 domain-containing protein [Rhodopseudomonas sp. BAL398]
MTDTANLGLPLIEASQAQKHVTHNEALRILDAAIQIAVADRDRTAPPPAPAQGDRHVVASAATGAWAGQAQAIATWQDGAWSFLAPRAGWCIWSVADDVLLVFDGASWRDLRDLRVSLANAPFLGVNTTADAANLLSVKSNAALFAAIGAGADGSGDIRVQLSKESMANTASVVFSDAYSGRAEFGLVGSDAFKLKVSADGAGWAEALVIDQASGNLALPRGLSLTGVVAPPPLSADQNDYAPAGLGAASLLQISSAAARDITGLAGGAEGRIITVINVGGQTLTLRDDSAASLAANRFALGGNLALPARQAAVLRYDGTAQRWFAIAAGPRPVHGSWTPTLGALAGSLGAASATGNYTITGNKVDWTVTINVANVGSAAIALTFSLPATPNGSYTGCGREAAVTGHGASVAINPGGGLVQRYDGGFLGGNGYVILAAGTFYT